jgi:hypothetical protein
MFKNIQKIDFTGGGLVSSRIIPHLKITDLGPGKIDIRNQISFCYLLMVKVVQYFAGRAERNIPG